MRTTTRAVAETWSRFAASDPGLLRLMAGLRTVSAIVLTLLVLAALGVPVMLLVAGAMTAMISSVAITEHFLRDQAVTLALGLPTALVSVTAGTLLAPHRVVADVVFIAVIFTAVYARRYGDRARSLGMMGFQLFFVTQFIQARPPMLPLLAVILCVAFGCGAVVRFGLLRITPEWILRRLLHAFRGRLVHAVRAMTELAERQATGQYHPPGAGRHARTGGAHRAGPDNGAGVAAAERVLRKRIARLHDCALMAQSRIEDASGIDVSALQRRVAGADVAAQRLAALLLVLPERAVAAEGGPYGHTHGAATVLDALRALRVLVERDGDRARGVGTALLRERLLGQREGDAAADQRPPEAREALRAAGDLAFALLGVRVAAGGGEGGEDTSRTERSLEELATEDLVLASGRRDDEDGPRRGAGESRPSGWWGRFRRARTAGAGPGGGPAGRGGDDEEEEPASRRGLGRPTTRAAFQVAVGSALAIVGGEFLSERRWYWAVLTCWVVFLGTTSTGEILVKGSRRLTGTMVGVVAGVGLTTLVDGNVVLAFTLVLVCVFAMFFTAPLSYTLMSFFTTTMLGLLYTLLHTYTPAVMVLRIEETALGAACGLLAALAVLPVRTRDHTDERLRDVLDALRDTVLACARHLEGPDHRTGRGRRAEEFVEAGRRREAAAGEGREAPGDRPGADGADRAGEAEDLASYVTELDSTLDDLHRSARPLTHPATPLRGRRGATRYVQGVLDSAGYHARALASTVEQLPAGSGAGSRSAAVAWRVAANLQVLVDRLGGAEPHAYGHHYEAADESLDTSADQGTEAATGRAVWVQRHLRRLDENVLGLAEPLSVPVAERSRPPARTGGPGAGNGDDAGERPGR